MHADSPSTYGSRSEASRTDTAEARQASMLEVLEKNLAAHVVAARGLVSTLRERKSRLERAFGTAKPPSPENPDGKPTPPSSLQEFDHQLRDAIIEAHALLGELTKYIP